MPCDYTVIMHQTAHLGDDPSMFGPAPFKGKDFDSDRFSCPNVKSSERAVLYFQTRDVDSDKNVIHINGSHLFGGIPVSSGGGDESPIWNGNVALVEAGVLKESGNVLHVGARDSHGSTLEKADDFLIDNVVIFYKTRSRWHVRDLFRR
jgi:hypothetical protein